MHPQLPVLHYNKPLILDNEGALYSKCRAPILPIESGILLRTLLPFDTEKERKPLKLSLKVFEISASYRQAAYLGINLLFFIQLIKWVLSGSMPFFINAISFFLCLVSLTPGIVFSFVKHRETGLFLDRYLWYYFRHLKNESGVWRRF